MSQTQSMNIAPELTGTLHWIGDVVVVSDKFKKREFVIEISEEVNGNTYTNFVKFQLAQMRVELLNNYTIGDAITVCFNFRGQRWEKDGKVNYFLTLDAWKIKSTPNEYRPYTPSADAQQNNQAAPQSPAPGNFYNPSPENVDDLPF